MVPESETEVVAFLTFGPSLTATYVLPDTVSVNDPFDVIIHPYLDCGSDAIPALVQVNGLTADVTARAMLLRQAISTCEGREKNTSIGSVTFASPGAAVVRIRGRDGESRQPVTIDVSVFVRGD
jgi:hypothetical protein